MRRIEKQLLTQFGMNIEQTASRRVELVHIHTKDQSLLL